MKSLLLLALVVGCQQPIDDYNTVAPEEPRAPAAEFKSGDCVDQKEWVGPSGVLHGNKYTKVVEKSIADYRYVVNVCVIKKDPVHDCELDSIDLEDYAPIKCP